MGVDFVAFSLLLRLPASQVILVVWQVLSSSDQPRISGLERTTPEDGGRPGLSEVKCGPPLDQCKDSSPGPLCPPPHSAALTAGALEPCLRGAPGPISWVPFGPSQPHFLAPLLVSSLFFLFYGIF